MTDQREGSTNGEAAPASGADAGESDPRSHRDRGRLERTLGLGEALTIGLGTMVGAGIFVFPGLAVAEAGPAAALSFALGAGVALLVALPTSEMATAMPRSGGGYYFVSRALGGGAGTLVGLGQWLGLVFASAFYLAGFGHYLVEVLGGLGVSTPLPAEALGFATAVALTAVGIVGTRTSGRLQYWVVAILVTILALFLGWGALRATGMAGDTAGLGAFAPHGGLPVLTTAALVFTSYLGFAQIANVAGEVREPARNLPRAMVGSVVIVGFLYVVTIVVSTAVIGPDAMGRAGETAMTEVGRALLGTTGALVIGAAGLLATLSSANASIMSSSRAVYALSRDGVVPEGVSRVSRRFRTPHVALVLTGVPIALLVLLGRLEVLAEVASILHLLLYGLICVAALAFRRADSLWYRPTFRSPGSPWLPGLGALLCFGLVAFMSPRALVWSGVILAAAGGWYLLRSGSVRLKGVEELAPAPEVRPANLLIQMSVPDLPGVPDELLRALSPDSVVLVGWGEVPEQSSAEQVRDELGDESRESLEATADRLREAGLDVETDLVFTGHLVQTIDRVSEEHDVDAVLSLRPVKRVDEVLVALRDLRRAEEAAGFAARVARATGARVRVVHPPRPEQEDEGAERLADEEMDAELRAVLLDAGLRPGEIEVATVGDGDEPSATAIMDAVGHADLVILGERDPGDESSTFGGLNETITRDAEVPVLIARNR